MNTKERIQYEALKLFSKKGYEAVGVIEIAEAVGIKAPSLYKHFKNKRAVFDSIVQRMSETDIERAREYEMPEETAEEDAEAYIDVPFEKIGIYTRAQFLYWTEEEFSSCFRRLLTLEQYKNDEMSQLYRQYISTGPLKFMADIFRSAVNSDDEAMQLALDFYGPMYLLYSAYDEAEDKESVVAALDRHIDSFFMRFKAEEGKNYIIRPETKEDYRETENVVREAFWNVYRPGCLEHYVLHCLRDDKDFVPELDFVMEKDGRIIGQVIYMRAFIDSDDGRKIPVMTMGPIGILPEYKRRGYGKALLDHSMEKAKEMGAGALCFEGNIDFYGKSGFVVASTRGIHYYAEPRENEVPYFLLKELEEGFLDGITGTYHTPKGYFVDENDAERFDLSFEPKEKLKLPGQLF